jgi:hypothetical protein
VIPAPSEPYGLVDGEKHVQDSGYVGWLPRPSQPGRTDSLMRTPTLELPKAHRSEGKRAPEVRPVLEHSSKHLEMQTTAIRKHFKVHANTLGQPCADLRARLVAPAAVHQKGSSASWV